MMADMRGVPVAWRDLTKLGGALVGGLVGLIVLQLVARFDPFTGCGCSECMLLVLMAGIV